MLMSHHLKQFLQAALTVTETAPEMFKFVYIRANLIAFVHGHMMTVITLDEPLFAGEDIAVGMSLDFCHKLIKNLPDDENAMFLPGASTITIMCGVTVLSGESCSTDRFPDYKYVLRIQSKMTTTESILINGGLLVNALLPYLSLLSENNPVDIITGKHNEPVFVTMYTEHGFSIQSAVMPLMP